MRRIWKVRYAINKPRLKLRILRSYSEPSVRAHAHTPSTWEPEEKDSVFKASLGYSEPFSKTETKSKQYLCP